MNPCDIFCVCKKSCRHLSLFVPQPINGKSHRGVNDRLIASFSLGKSNWYQKCFSFFMTGHVDVKNFLCAGSMVLVLFFAVHAPAQTENGDLRRQWEFIRYFDIKSRISPFPGSRRRIPGQFICYPIGNRNLEDAKGVGKG